MRTPDPRLAPAGLDGKKLKVATQALFDLCPDYGVLERLAHALSQAGIEAGVADPQLRQLLSMLACGLFQLHDDDVK